MLNAPNLLAMLERGMDINVQRAIFLGGELDWQDMPLPLADSIIHGDKTYILGSWTDDSTGVAVPCYAMQGMKVSDIEHRVQSLLWLLVELPDDLTENRFWVAKGLVDAWDVFAGSLADVVVENGYRLKEEKKSCRSRYTS